MPYITEQELTFSRILTSWWETANLEVDMIGGWRDADDATTKRDYFERQRRACDSTTDALISDFQSLTTHVVAELSERFPKIDPTPLMQIFQAVSAWHRDKNANRIPDQKTLQAWLDQALIIGNVLNLSRDRRASKTPIGENDVTPTAVDKDILIADIKTKLGCQNTSIRNWRKKAGIRDDQWPTKGKSDTPIALGVLVPFLEYVAHEATPHFGKLARAWLSELEEALSKTH